jgi:hypothetical protein
MKPLRGANPSSLLIIWIFISYSLVSFNPGIILLKEYKNFISKLESSNLYNTYSLLNTPLNSLFKAVRFAADIELPFQRWVEALCV